MGSCQCITGPAVSEAFEALTRDRRMRVLAMFEDWAHESARDGFAEEAEFANALGRHLRALTAVD